MCKLKYLEFYSDYQHTDTHALTHTHKHACTHTHTCMHVHTHTRTPNFAGCSIHQVHFPTLKTKLIHNYLNCKAIEPLRSVDLLSFFLFVCLILSYHSFCHSKQRLRRISLFVNHIIITASAYSFLLITFHFMILSYHSSCHSKERIRSLFTASA